MTGEISPSIYVHVNHSIIRSVDHWSNQSTSHEYVMCILLTEHRHLHSVTVTNRPSCWPAAILACEGVSRSVCLYCVRGHWHALVHDMPQLFQHQHLHLSMYMSKTEMDTKKLVPAADEWFNGGQVSHEHCIVSNAVHKNESTVALPSCHFVTALPPQKTVWELTQRFFAAKVQGSRTEGCH